MWWHVPGTRAMPGEMACRSACWEDQCYQGNSTTHDLVLLGSSCCLGTREGLHCPCPTHPLSSLPWHLPEWLPSVCMGSSSMWPVNFHPRKAEQFSPDADASLGLLHRGPCTQPEPQLHSGGHCALTSLTTPPEVRLSCQTGSSKHGPEAHTA